MADFKLQVSGTAAQPSLEAHVHLKGLALDQERIAISTSTPLPGKQLEINAHSEFEKADLTITGTVALDMIFPPI